MISYQVTWSILCFLAQFIFSLADNDTDISKTLLNKGEQIIKLDFYLFVQNTENFALSVPSKFEITHSSFYFENLSTFLLTLFALILSKFFFAH